MNNNLVRSLALSLLVGVASPVLAAPAPVSDLQIQNTSPDVQQLERLISARNQLQLDMQRQLNQMSSEVDNLRGLVERSNYELKQMLTRQRELYQEVDSLRQQLKNKTVASTGKETAKTSEYSSDRNENEAYDKAVALVLQDKNFSGAINAFQDFLKKYPQSSYVTNANYWLGQLYFSQNKVVEAQAAFIVVTNNKSSSKRADALLKLGVISERQKNNTKARSYYQQVVDNYPESTSSRQALQYLQN